MKTYYVAGLPYSDELWHYGVKGQKWGQRLYQNPDGTLTPLGKVHYSAKNTAKTIGNAAVKATKTVVRHEVDKYKDRHKWLMSETELKEKIYRAQLEKQYNDLLRSNRLEVSRGRKLVGDMLTDGAKTISRGVFDKITEQIKSEMFKPEKKASEQLAEEFLEDWNSKGRTSKEDLEELSSYIALVRSIEGGNGGKKGGGKKGGG